VRATPRRCPTMMTRLLPTTLTLLLSGSVTWGRAAARSGRTLGTLLGRSRRAAAIAVLGGLVLANAPATASPSPDMRCLLGSGRAATRCLRRYTHAIAACRATADAACE